ncbi:MAG: hypothetical protein V1921_08860 [Candidatus Altiarchaeota archaeon]
MFMMGLLESKLPSIRKDVSSFLTEEEGKITRESLSVLGSVVGAVSLGYLMLSISDVKSQFPMHTNQIVIGYDDVTGTVTGQHTNTFVTHTSA